MLGNIFGASVFGVVLTTAGFLGGLGAGSWFGSAFLRNVKKPLLWLAIIEGLVGLFAFNLPTIFEFLDLSTQSESLTEWYFVQSISVLIIISLPAFLLGAGFPLVISALGDSSKRLALIYGFNTLGGVIGALLPIILLPSFGWTVSTRLIALLSIALAFAFLILSWKHSSSLKNVAVPSPNKMSGRQLWMPFLLYGLIGCASIMLQIAWTRLFGMVLLRTEYVLAVIIATFLLGIAIGSLVSPLFRNKIWLAVFPILAAFLAVTILWVFPFVASWADGASFTSLVDAGIQQAFFILMCTLPVTLIFGLWFPLLAKSLANLSGAGPKLYAVNSIGAALGAIFAGFIFTPLIGTSAVVILAAALLLLAGLYWANMRTTLVAATVLMAFSIPVFSLPAVHELLPNSQASVEPVSDYEDALSVTHVVKNEQGYLLMLADLQRMDASTEPTAVSVQENQARLPLLLVEQPKSVLFLGLGTGITAAGSLPFGEMDRTAVELSVGAIQAANESFSRVNQGVTNKITVVHDDARRYLKRVDRQFDVIVGDLFHPDFVGRSALLSIQQFQRASDRLSDRGIFTQWLALNQFDLASLKVVLNSFKQVFPYNALFVDGFRLALVGSKQPIDVESLLPGLSYLPQEATGGEGVWTWFGRYWGAIPDLPGVPVQDEWSPVIEFSLPAARYTRGYDLASMTLYLLKMRQNALDAAKDIGVSALNFAVFERAYNSTTMIYSSWLANFRGQAENGQKFLMLAFEANPLDRWIGFDLADRMFSSVEQQVMLGDVSEREALQRVLAIRPDHLGALRKLHALALRESLSSEAEDLLRKIERLDTLD